MNTTKTLLIGLFLLMGLGLNAQEKLETERVKAGYRTIYTDILIDASPEQVWAVLTDTETYPEWAARMRRIEGEIKDQGEIEVDFQMNKKKEKLTTVHHRIAVTEGKEFSWSEVFMMGMSDHHQFRVEAAPGGKTRFVQADLVTGGWTWLLGKKVINLESEIYPEFNRSLKQEVERRYKP